MNDVEGIVRVGQVSSIDEQAGTVRVIFSDRDNSVSYDFPVTYPLTQNDKMYYMPTIQEWLVCVLLPNNPAQGFILGSYYSETRKPPVTDKNLFHIRFEDGTILEYDKQSHKLTVDVPENGDKSIEVSTASDIAVRTQKKIVVEAAEALEIKVGTDIKVMATANISIEALGDIAISGGGNITVEGKQSLTLKGKTSSMVL